MTRGQLPDDVLATIADNLPDLQPLYDRLLGITPDFVSIGFPHDSDVPIALVCLTDCLYTIADTQFALHEAYANRVYHREFSVSSNELGATRVERFFLDDVALRLYAAGEHLANGIEAMLGIPRSAINRKQQPKGSWQAAVGKYLLNHQPNHPLSTEVGKLVSSQSWTFVIDYRNKWVHDQPPPIAGLGLVYRRKRRWIVSGEHRALGLGTADEPEFAIDLLRDSCTRALNEFVEVLNAVVQHYVTILEAHGYRGI